MIEKKWILKKWLSTFLQENSKTFFPFHHIILLFLVSSSFGFIWFHLILAFVFVLSNFILILIGNLRKVYSLVMLNKKAVASLKKVAICKTGTIGQWPIMNFSNFALYCVCIKWNG